MSKSKFLQEISSLKREEINEYIEKNSNSRVKIIYPVIVLKNIDNKKEDKWYEIYISCIYTDSGYSIIYLL